VKDKKKGKSSYMYFIKWKGYEMSDNTWEPRANLANIERDVKAFDDTFDEIKRKKAVKIAVKPPKNCEFKFKHEDVLGIIRIHKVASVLGVY
jgi:hypothetical protein